QSVSERLKAIGVAYVPFPLNRTGISPLRDLHTLYYLTRKMNELKPDVVFSYTAKPVVYGSMAARIAGVRNVFSMITGLGYVFIGETWRQKVLAKILILLYKMTFKFNKQIYFHNPDDLELFKKLNILPGGQKAVVVNGSGVNIDHFAYSKPRTDKIVFLIIARLLWDKGIGEFVSAARLLKKKYPDVSWRIVGPEYLGATDDVRPYIADASVYVLPSYREGRGQSIVEAMSMGRPIITSDAPGCRETVVQGVNGFLVPVRDPEMLSIAMEKFIQNTKLITEMGIQSREITEAQYDENKVNHIILETMGLKTLTDEQTECSWDLVSKSS
ncbi:MAG: hypothetical protein H6Q76_2616, partial [Firmicutes bacterium]|nr:hypothetical protein [Bacillota bacterium]